MSWTEAYHCNECGAIRQSTNHWFELRKDPEKMIGTSQAFILTGFIGNKSNIHLCGQSCVQKALDRWMSTGKLEKPKEQKP